MALKWWQTQDIVARESTLTRQKAESVLADLAEKERLRHEQERKEAGERFFAPGKEKLAHLKAMQRVTAADEIKEANRALSQLGVSWELPISESSLKQQIMSGRTWAQQTVLDTEQEIQSAQQEAEAKLRSDIVGGLLKKGTIIYDTPPDEIERLVQQKIAEHYAEEAFKQGDYDIAKQWRDRALELAEPPEVEQPEKWPGYIEMWERQKAEVAAKFDIPEEGIEIADGIRVMPDFKVYSDDDPSKVIGTIDPETGDFREAKIGAGERVKYALSQIWNDIPVRPYYWMTPEQKALADYKNQLVTWAEEQDIENPEEWVNNLMEQPTGEVAMRAVSEEELAAYKKLPPMPSVAERTSTWEFQGYTRGDQFIGEWLAPLLTLYLLKIPGPAQVSKALEVPAHAGRAVTRVGAQVVRGALKPAVALERGIGNTVGAIIRRVPPLKRQFIDKPLEASIRNYLRQQGVTNPTKTHINLYKQMVLQIPSTQANAQLQAETMNVLARKFGNKAVGRYYTQGKRMSDEVIRDIIAHAKKVGDKDLQKAAEMFLKQWQASTTADAQAELMRGDLFIKWFGELETGGVTITDEIISKLGSMAARETETYYPALYHASMALEGQQAAHTLVVNNLAELFNIPVPDITASVIAKIFGEGVLPLSATLITQLTDLGIPNAGAMSAEEAWAALFRETLPALAEAPVEEIEVPPVTEVTPEVTTPTVKEPWQMTQAEYVAANRGSWEMHKLLVQEKLKTQTSRTKKVVPAEVLKDYPDLAETTAMAEGETITGEITEGEVTIEGLEPVRNIRRIETRFRQKQATYDETRKQLVVYAKEHLPVAVRGKMLAAVKNVKTELDLTRAIAQADKYAEQAAQKTIKTKITSELRKIRPTKVAGMRYGKFTAETQRQLNQIKKNTQLDRENVKDRIIKNIEAAEEGKISFEEADEANEILQVSGLKGMSSDELAYTLRHIKSLKETGRGLRAAEKEAELERITKKREAFITVLTGGKGIKPGVGTVDTRGMEVREGKVRSAATNWQYGLDDIGDKLSKFDKTSRGFGSIINKTFDDLHLSRSIQFAGTNHYVDKRLAAKIAEIYGTKGQRELDTLLNRMYKDKINLGTFETTEGKTVTLSLTKGQIRKKYMELQDPTLEETFRIGMKWSNPMINAIGDSLTVEDLKFIHWQLGLYQEYGLTIKPTFEAKYHIPWPGNPHFSPLNRDLESTVYEHVLMAQDNYRYAGVTSNSLKARVKNRIPLRFTDDIDVLVNHLVRMEHFKAFSASMKEARMIFGNKEVRTAIRQYHGQDILNHLDRHLNQIARDGVDRALTIHWMDMLRRNFAVSVLAKPAIAMRQAMSLPAYLTYEPMPLADFFTGIADYWKHPIANSRKMKQLSGYFEERWGRGFERDVRLATQKGVAARLSNSKNWRDLLMLGIRGMDTITTQAGSWAVYRSMKKQHLSEQEAILHAELATKRSQPSFGLEDMAALRKQGSFWKLATMFQSQPNKYYRLIANSARNLQYGRGSKGRNVLNILLAWWILPMMFQLAVDAFQWKEEHQLRVALLGPANFLLAGGQLVQTAWGWLTKEPFGYQPSPVLSTFDEIRWAFQATVKMIEDGKDPLKEVDTDYFVSTIEHYAKAAGQLTGIPTPYAVQVERAIRNADIRQLLFSQYALKTEDDAISLLQDIYAREVYGKDKWRELTNEQQDRFWQLRPDLK